MKNLFLAFSVLLVCFTYAQETNVKKLIKLAEKGDVKAQTELANAYFEGKGVKRSYQDGVMWLEKVAEKGDATAQYQVALCYFEGKGVVKSDEKGAEWLGKAATSGHKEAEEQLALCYRDGRGVPQSNEMYYQWVEKNADNASPEAQLELAKAYYAGTDVKKDVNKAKYWAEKAAAKGVLEAEYLLAVWVYEINPTNPEALQRLTKVANKGNANAQTILAEAYLKGQGVEKSEEKAIQWFEKAAAKGQPEAQYYLANYYFFGNSPLIGKSYKKALDLYSKSAARGNADAQRQLSVCLYNGIGGNQSYRDAFNMVLKSVNANPSDITENNLGVCYLTGNGSRQSASHAVELFEKSAQAGNVSALYNLGASLLEEGQLDVRKAFDCLEKAANQNHLLALKKLGDLYYNGKYTNQSFERAFEYYTRASKITPTPQDQMLEYFYQQEEEAYAEVLYLLSLCYAEGNGVKKSLKDAAKFAIQAAERSNKDAFEWLLKKVEANDPKESPEVILTVADGFFYGKGTRKQNEKAFPLYEKLAKQENTKAQKRLIEYYFEAKNPKKDAEKAVLWAEKVAKKGDAETQCELGKYYMTLVPNVAAKKATATGTTSATTRTAPISRTAGKGGAHAVATPMKRINESKGIHWLTKASEQNNPEAQNELGSYYHDKQELAQAIALFQKSAQRHYPAGEYNLGNCYYNGSGVDRSFEKAAEYYQQAARGGYAPAQFRLGHCYYHGEGIAQSDDRAADWFDAACDGGEKKACDMLKVVMKK